MAEEKKSSGGSGGMGPVADGLFWVLLALVIISVFGSLTAAIGFNFSLPSATTIVAFIINKLQVFSIFISLVFFTGIIYFNYKLGEILHHGAHGHVSHAEKDIPVRSHISDKRWLHVMEKMSSPNEADWRVAVIEADIILEDMLTRMGYHGESVAEKLKKVEKSDFQTIQSAWDAHKIRNEIAHGGSTYKLGRSQAERAISLFKEVFEEFYFI